MFDAAGWSVGANTDHYTVVKDNGDTEIIALSDVRKAEEIVKAAEAALKSRHTT